MDSPLPRSCLALCTAVLGFALLAAAIVTGAFPPPRADVTETRERLANLQHAVDTGQTVAVAAITGSLAAGLGAGVPAEIGPDLDRIGTTADLRERELAIAHARGILDELDRARPPRLPPLLVAMAGVFMTATLAALWRANRLLRRSILLHELRLRLPAEPSSACPAQSTPALEPEFGRILEIRAVDDP